ncbi:MAG: hypothetical protein JWM98_2491 [Thermoleophilia bacterium]|nr:hypothetical protein [Thermoleophilia bacterium]
MTLAPSAPERSHTSSDDRGRASAPSLLGLATRLSEIAAFAAAAMYGFGVLRITGELRGLDMSTPNLLANFEHSDVLMVGVGVLASHIASTAVMAGLAVLLVFADVRDRVSAVLERRRPLARAEMAVLIVAWLGLLAGARWWEGFVFVAVVLVMAGVMFVRRAPLSAGLVGLALVVGLLLNGVVGSYLNPPPLMAVTIEHDGETTDGLLIGNGERGEWYVATRADRHVPYHVAIIGGDGGTPARLTIRPAQDSGYRVAWSALVDAVD